MYAWSQPKYLCWYLARNTFNYAIIFWHKSVSFGWNILSTIVFHIFLSFLISLYFCLYHYTAKFKEHGYRCRPDCMTSCPGHQPFFSLITVLVLLFIFLHYVWDSGKCNVLLVYGPSSPSIYLYVVKLWFDVKNLKSVNKNCSNHYLFVKILKKWII